MTEFKYCVYCEEEPAICFATEADAMKFAREDTSMYKEVRVEKTEIDEAGEIVNSEVIWSASNVGKEENEATSDNEFDTEFPVSDIENVEASDDIDFSSDAWLDQPNLKEAVDALEENESEVECKCCFELFPKEKCIKTEKGYICPVCNQELHSHQGTNLDLIDADPFDLSYEDPRDPEEPEEPEIKDKPVDENELRKFEAGIEETLEEHINDRPADIESDQVLQGTDNAVVNCDVAKVIAHSEDEKPVDCKLEKPALEEPLAGEKVDAKLYEDTVDASLSKFNKAGGRPFTAREEEILQIAEDGANTYDWAVYGAINSLIKGKVKAADETEAQKIATKIVEQTGAKAEKIEVKKLNDGEFEVSIYNIKGNASLFDSLEEPLAGEEVNIKLNEDFSDKLIEDLKVIIDFSEYKPWSGAVDTYELIKDADKLDELEAYLEDCYPDGITATQINDILWFDGEEVLKYLGLGDTEEDEDIDENLNEYWWQDDDPMNWSDKEPLVYSCYYDYQLLGYLEYPYMGYENYPTTIEEDIAKYFELPESFDKEKIGWQNVGWEYEIDETKPLIKVEESLTEETLTEGPHLKSTWLDSVYSAKKYFIFKKTKGSTSFEKDAKVFTKINDAIKYATELSKKTDIIATSIRSDNKTFIIAEKGKITKSYINDLVNDIKTDNKLSKLGKGASGSSTDELEDELDKSDEVKVEATKIKIKFNANGGAGTTEDIEADKGAEATLPECKFTAPEGKKFKTWEVNGIERAVGTKLTFDEDTEIKAIWEDTPVDVADDTPKEASEEEATEVSAEEETPKEEKPVDKKNEARKRYIKVIKALQDAGYNVSDLRDGRKVTQKLKDLVKALFTESLEERVDLPAFDSDVKVGDKIRIVHLEGEDNSYDGKEGTVDHIDSIGQLHGSWGGLAVIPGVDDFDIITENLEEAVAKPEVDKVACYNDGLKLAKAYNKPVIYGYTNSSYGNKFFKLDDPIICDNVSDETKKFRQQYKSCNVAYVAYPSGQLIECLLEELPEGTTEVDYVEYKHSYCHALEPKLEELKKIEDIEELKKAILDIINNDPQVNWTKKEKKFAAIVRHKKWKSVEDLKTYLDNSFAKAKEIKVSVDTDGELVKKLTEEIEFDENGDEIFTPEEQEEFDCDEWGYSNDGYDQYHHCGWCEEIFPESEMRHEVDFGWICSRCEDELKSHGGPLTFIENEDK